MNPEHHQRPEIPEVEKPKATKEGSFNNIARFKLIIQMGRKIQESTPQVAEDYQNGLSFSKIAEKYGIQNAYGLETANIARMAVEVAIKGFVGRSKELVQLSFTGLINPETAKRIGQEHARLNGSRNGAATKERGTGIFGLTEEDRTQLGLDSDIRNRKNSTGFYGMTNEQKITAGQNSARSRGFSPFTADERAFILNTHKSADYKTKSGRYDAIKATEALNKTFHNGEIMRTSIQLNNLIGDQKRRKKI